MHSTVPLLVSRREAAKLLGISPSMVDKLVRTRRLEKIKIGTKVMFRRLDIEHLARMGTQRKTTVQ
jgi:excisionase family DNA binding protein